MLLMMTYLRVEFFGVAHFIFSFVTILKKDVSRELYFFHLSPNLSPDAI